MIALEIEKLKDTEKSLQLAELLSIIDDREFLGNLSTSAAAIEESAPAIKWPSKWQCFSKPKLSAEATASAEVLHGSFRASCSEVEEKAKRLREEEDHPFGPEPLLPNVLRVP